MIDRKFGDNDNLHFRILVFFVDTLMTTFLMM